MERLDYRGAFPEAWRALGAFARTVDEAGLGHELIELVKLRASQINGCANCVNLHASRLREAGTTEERLQNVVVWWEASCFDERERAALAWTDAVTRVAETRVPDEVYEQVRARFDERELAALTYAICAINSHNRLAVAFRRAPGS